MRVPSESRQPAQSGVTVSSYHRHAAAGRARSSAARAGAARARAAARLVDDGLLDALDGDRRLVDAEHAGALARRGAHAAGKLGEVVRLQQPVQRLAPAALVHQVVPLRDQVAQRAPCAAAARVRVYVIG
jgi:hypothetical protein